MISRVLSSVELGSEQEDFSDEELVVAARSLMVDLKTCELDNYSGQASVRRMYVAPVIGHFVSQITRAEGGQSDAKLYAQYISNELERNDHHSREQMIVEVSPVQSICNQILNSHEEEADS